MAKITANKSKKDTEIDTFKKECEGVTKTGYTIKEVSEILIQRVLKRWKIKNQEE